ncbi:MAG: hypothetical protein ABJC19_04045 [Gemmatimonadota bacterium]
MRLAPGWLFRVMWALGVSAPMVAQSPSDRMALQLWRDSLSRIQDTTVLRTLESASRARAQASRADPLLHLRRGFALLQLIDAGASTRDAIDDAASEFEWAAELRPAWPYPWLGLGLAEAAAPNHAGGFAGGLFTMLGLDRPRVSGEAFARAVQLDPTFVEGLVGLAQSAREQLIDPPLRPALDALRAATRSPAGWHPALLLERGRIERLVGDPDSARVAFSRASLLALDPAIAWVELARTIPLTADTLAAVPGRQTRTELAYYAAARSDNAEAVAMLRRDLEPIVDDSILDDFDRLHGDARSEWLRTFWRQRGAVDLRVPASRLAEHFRRWAVARRDFRLPPFRRRYRWGFELFHSGDAELDDRGIVWLRHGEPTARVVWPRSRPSTRVDPLQRNSGNESWRYARPEGDLVLHFVATDDPDDFRLVDNPLQLDVAVDQLERHADEVPGLARLLRAGHNSITWVAEEERARGRRSMAIATQSDSWERQYAARLDGRAQWFAVGIRNGSPLVHLVYALDATALRTLPGTGRIPITIRAVFLDATGQPTATLDTVQFLPRPGLDTRLLAGRAEVVVPAGRQLVRLGIDAGGSLGAVYPLDSLVVGAVTGRRFGVSALLVGRSPHSLAWAAAPGDTAWLDASGVYAPNDTLTVYAELYGLPAGARPTVRLTVRRLRSGLARLFGGGDELSLREEVSFVAAPGRWHRSVVLGGLAPGNYSIDLTVEQRGERVIRRRGLVIRDRE